MYVEDFEKLLDELIELAKDAGDGRDCEAELKSLRERVIRAWKDEFDEGYVCGANTAIHG